MTLLLKTNFENNVTSNDIIDVKSLFSVKPSYMQIFGTIYTSR